MDSTVSDLDGSINTCIVLNKAVQHIIPDILSCIRDEVKQLSVKQRELEEIDAIPRGSGRYVRRPFLKFSSEVPPLNEDALLRRERKEVNLTDAKSAALKKWSKAELISLVTGVARCARDRQVTLLSAQREALLSKLAASKQKRANSSASNSRASLDGIVELLTNLRSVEDRLERFRGLTSTPPKGLISALLSVSLDAKHQAIPPQTTEMKIVWNKRVFEGYNGPKFIREHHANTWYELLTSADELLRSSEWEEISVKDVHSQVTPTNLHLIWHHRLRPQVNHGQWTTDEDNKLIDLVKQHGQRGKWEQIAAGLANGRTAFGCIQRWQTKLNADFRHGRPWTAEEDTALLDILKRLLEHYPPTLIDWDVVSAFHTTRTASECRKRAKIISPVFSTVRANGPALLSLKKPWYDGQLDRVSEVQPFTPNEDLQLLMGIQRYGLAGGRLGSGAGIGVGSWAVICSALPGRSIRTCQKRYLELCDQFQPWTYSEDRKLYRMRLQMEPDPTSCKQQLNLIKPFTNLVKYFPGRSVYSLRQRFALLYRYSRILASLKKIIVNQAYPMSNLDSKELIDANQAQTSISKDADSADESRELRQLLLYAPFTSSLISRLRDLAVSDPEAEALRLLTSWKKDGPQMTTSSGIPITLDSEFSLLLDDLASGQVTPFPLIADMPGSMDDGNVDTILDEDESAFISATPPVLYTSTKLASHVLTKQFLSRPIRECLLTTIRRSLTRETKLNTSLCSTTRSFIDEGTHLSPILLHSSSLCNNGPFRPGTENRAEAALLLLDDRNKFDVVLDRALRHPKAKCALARKNQVANLATVAPLLSGLMIRQVTLDKKHTTLSTEINEDCVNDTIDTVTSDAPMELDASASEHVACSDNNSQSPKKPETANEKSPCNVGWYSGESIGGKKRHRLLEIRRTIFRFGPRGTDVYSLAKVEWLNAKEESSASGFVKRQSRYIPLILKELPVGFAQQIRHNPLLVTEKCRFTARNCVRDGLGLTQIALPSCDGTSEKSSSPFTAHVLPPNCATIFAFKSLLLHIPSLVRRAQNHFTEFIRTRALLHHLTESASDLDENSSEGTSQPREGLSQNQLIVAETILSPEYRRFITVGLNLLLWPGVLSTLPAHAFVESGKRHWLQAFAQIPQDVLDDEPPMPPSKVPRTHLDTSYSDSLCSSSDDDSSDEQYVPVRYKPRPRVSYERPFNQRRKKRKPRSTVVCQGKQQLRTYRSGIGGFSSNHTISLQMSHDTSEGYTLLLPAAIQTLFACGFRTHSISRISK